MSDSTMFSASSVESAALAGGIRIDYSKVDLHSPHQFWFGQRTWSQSLGKVLQATVLLAAGIFLLMQASATPKLFVQMSMVGGLLATGGVAILLFAVSEARSRLIIDQKGISARTGLTGFSIPWSRIDRWSISESNRHHGQCAALAVWGVGNSQPMTIADSYFDESDRRLVHRVLRAFAFEKEADKTSSIEIVRR